MHTSYELSDVTFGHTKANLLLMGVPIDVGLDWRTGLNGANGTIKSTVWLEVLIGEVMMPTSGQPSRIGVVLASLLAHAEIDDTVLAVGAMLLGSSTPGLGGAVFASDLTCDAHARLTAFMWTG
ncbi:hypothetical protein JCM5296_001390 [Sporobolomyces johnsonii]